MDTTHPTNHPTPHAAFEAYCNREGDLAAAAADLSVSIADLVLILTTLMPQLAAWESLRAAEFRLRALKHQAAAADALELVIASSSDAVEIRRAATTLSTLARAMARAGKPPASLAPAESAAETPDQPRAEASPYPPPCDVSSRSSSSPSPAAPSNAPRSHPTNSPSARSNSSAPSTSTSAKSRHASSAA